MSASLDPLDIPIRAVVLRNENDTNISDVREAAWRDLLGARHVCRTAKSGRAFVPADFRQGGSRCKADVERVNALVFDLDFDKRPDSEGDALTVIERAKDLAGCIVYTTHSHNAEGPGDWRFRLIFPTTRPMTVEEHARIWAIVNAKLGGLADPSAKDASRLFFLPSCPPDRADAAVIDSFPGPLLDVDALLAEAPEVEARTRRAAPRTRGAARAPKSRHDRATALAGRLRNQGANEETILARLRAKPGIATLATERPGELERIARDAATKWTRRYPCTDTGNAERLIDRNSGLLRYVTKWGKWIIFDGVRWNLDGADLQLIELATEAARSIPEEVEAETAKRVEEADALEAAGEVKDAEAETLQAVGDAKKAEEARKHAEGQRIEAEKKRKLVEAERKEARAWAKKSESKGALMAAVDLARAQPGIAIGHVDLDADPWLLNCENGTLDLRTGELRPHDPADLLTKIAPVAYDPAATAPTWERFVLEVMGGDGELAAFLQRAVGYSLTGDVSEHALFFLYGSGANGKSTLVNSLLGLLGDYAGPGEPNLLIARRGESHPTGQADLVGRRFVTCQEVEEGRRWDEVLLKQLTGGDSVKARRMREDFWSFTPTHKFWVSGNHKPNARGTDDGLWRRLKLIPFEQSFLGREDRKLPGKLREELPGILAWAVRGCLAWQERGLDEPESIRAATAAYRAEEDSIGAFLADRCEVGEGFQVARKQIRRAYELWCEEEGFHPLGAKPFSGALRARGMDEIKSMRTSPSSSPERGWGGVRLRMGAEGPALRVAK